MKVEICYFEAYLVQ